VASLPTASTPAAESRDDALPDARINPAADIGEAVVRAEMTDSARLLAVLESGDDPFDILEATAAIAGGPGGDDGGSRFVRLARIAESTTPLDLAYPRPGHLEEALPRLSGAAGAADTGAGAPGDGGGDLGGGGTPGGGGDPGGGAAQQKLVIGEPGVKLDAATDYNIALVLDKSGSMNSTWGVPPDTKSRLEVARQALQWLVDSELKNHAGTINLTLITFQDGYGDPNDSPPSINHISIENLTPDAVQQVLDKIEALTAIGAHSTPYAEAFKEATSWFNSMEAAGYTEAAGYKNLTFFVTDGKPEDQNPADRESAFEALAAVSEVRAIGIGSDVPQETLDRYDTSTDKLYRGIDVDNYREIANFDNNDGINDPSHWDTADSDGPGTVIRTDDGRLRITDTNATDNSYFSVTMQDVMVVTPEEAGQYGVYFRFNGRSPGNAWVRNLDTFKWELLKLDEASGLWVVVDTHIDTGTFMSAQNPVTTFTSGIQDAGSYKFRFSVKDGSDNAAGARIDIDDIHVHQTTMVKAQLVLEPDELEAALNGGGASNNPPVGDDTLHGDAGNDIIFGDALNADGLPWGDPGNPDKPSDKTGLDALKFFLAETLGHPPGDDELHAYITANSALFDLSSGALDGNDTLYGEAGDDILYGQGGNDILYGGAGNDMLYGGEGNDILVGGPGDDVLIGGPGDDTFRWLDGDAGSVANPAVDIIKDFGMGGTDPNGHDVLDLRDLLQGEENSTDLSRYLNFSYDGTDTVLKVSSTGALLPDGSGFDQLIRLGNVDLPNGQSNQNQIISDLIAAGKLQVDA